MERWEYYRPSSFWFWTIIGCFCFTTFFSHSPSSVQTPSQAQLVIQEVRAGAQPEGARPWWKVFRKAKPSTTASKPEISKPEIPKSSYERVSFSQSSGNPGNGGNGGNGNGNGNFNDEIGTKKWENRVCPKPEEIISNPGFWNDLADDPEICTDEDDCDFDFEDEEDFDFEDEDEETKQEIPRRRLLEVPTPTGKLDSQRLEQFDFTNKKLQPMTFPSREGIELSMDQRSLRKAVYGHSQELGLSDLGSRVPCPLQVDPNKFQRTDCWAVTDANIREAVIKIFEFTTFNNPRIITLERFPPNCSTQRATYFVDIVSGNAVYFRIGGKQNGKLWSLDNFKSSEIINMMKDPNVKKITDISDYNFNF